MLHSQISSYRSGLKGMVGLISHGHNFWSAFGLQGVTNICVHLYVCIQNFAVSLDSDGMPKL